MSTADQEPRNVEIRMDRIPVGRGIAALLAIALIVGAMMLELPTLRVPAIAGIAGGVIVGVLLILWHRRSLARR